MVNDSMKERERKRKRNRERYFPSFSISLLSSKLTISLILFTNMTLLTLLIHCVSYELTTTFIIVYII